MKERRILKNTGSLMVFNMAKIVFPFVTLPYLTRVFSTEAYGAAAYVKTVMGYMQIIVDFGFVLSATKDIVHAKNDKEKMAYVIGDTLLAKAALGLAAFLFLAVLACALPILRGNALYTFLSYIAVFESIFLMDFLFRGLEVMHVITARFIVMKSISTVLTFLLVKDDSDILLVPVFDILGGLMAVLLVLSEVKRLGLSARFSGLRKVYGSIRDSFMYFLSNVASTSFNALSTLVIGLGMSAADVAYWSVCMQVVTAAQACYTPISDGIYPEMIKSRDIGLIYKVLRWTLPAVAVGCVLAYGLAGVGMELLGGEEYLPAVPVFRLLIPVLFFGFLSIIFGWPSLGAVGRTKETTASTVLAVVFNIVCLAALAASGCLTLANAAIARVATETVLFGTRFYYFNRFRYLFETDKEL